MTNRIDDEKQTDDQINELIVDGIKDLKKWNQDDDLNALISRATKSKLPKERYEAG